MSELPAIVLQLLGLGLVLGAIEWCYPNRAEQRRLRPQVATDLAFYFGQHLVWLSVQLAGLLLVRELIIAVIPNGVGDTFAVQPFGTYHCPSRQHHDLGLPGHPKKSYLGWLLRPHT